MEEVSDRLATIDGLRIAVVGEKPVPPAAYVTYPESITFDGAYGRGQDSMELQIVVIVGNVIARATRTALAAYCEGNGTDSVKSVVDGDDYVSCDSVTVTGVDFDVVRVASIDHMAAMFAVKVVGSGG